MLGTFRFWTGKTARLLLRVVLSVLALWLVSRRVDLREALVLMGQLHPGWVALGVGAFACSHLASSERSRWLWSAAGAPLTRLEAWRLYWLGAFYSLFLPGGVGGDGYKVYALKRYGGVSLGALVKAGLLDRGFGVAVILWLSMGLALFVLPLPKTWILLVYAALLLFFPLIWLGMRLFFRSFLPVFGQAVGYSVVKQVLQAFAAICLLLATGTAYHPAYPLAFLLSSLALLLPISVGGMGARELVLSYLPPEFPINEEAAVAMSLLFFLLNALFSLAGAMAKGPGTRSEGDAS
jgi:hypothetical protein